MIPLKAQVDVEHGGRWTSLSGDGREWLWSREEPARAVARPGDVFADAGGLEECFPTISGSPDHGDVWARTWNSDGDTCTVETAAYVLARTMSEVDGAVVADYRLTAAPGFRFIWAAHALLNLSEEARVLIPDGTVTTVFIDARSAGAGPWPAPLGVRLDELGPRDGSATSSVIDASEVTVADGADRLTFRLDAEGQPRSVAYWRNLGGWPEGEPYRSIGIEPMLGRAFELEGADPEACAIVPASGVVTWRLTVSATREGRSS